MVIQNIFTSLVALALASARFTDAQQPGKVPRIGYLTATGAEGSWANLEAFRRGLRDLGYNERKNILIEYRYYEPKLDRMPNLVAELVQLKVDVLVSPTLPRIRAAMQATKMIPIVMVTNYDPP
jgi:putative tryptophan/tyrosine transport system substrate-binding protein